MPPKKASATQEVEDLLAKLLALNMWTAGAKQNAIAHAVGRGNTWVNDFLKDVPKPKSLKVKD